MISKLTKIYIEMDKKKISKIILQKPVEVDYSQLPFEIILQKPVEVDYSQLSLFMNSFGGVTSSRLLMDSNLLKCLKSICPLSNIRKVNSDINKVKLSRTTGKEKTNLILTKLEPETDYKLARSLMDFYGVEQAGLNELLHFTSYFQEVPAEDFYIVALRDKMSLGGVDLATVISCIGKKKAGNIDLIIRDSVPFLGNTYFLGVTDKHIALK